MPPPVRDSVLSSLAGHIEPTMHTGAAAVEYTDIIRGRQEFAVYYRLLPWDHGAPALMLVESGGTVEHLDGRWFVESPGGRLTVAFAARNDFGILDHEVTLPSLRCDLNVGRTSQNTEWSARWSGCNAGANRTSPRPT